jgi:hypothetical protein
MGLSHLPVDRAGKSTFEFENAGSRKRVRGYVLGLLSHAERKNGWTLAEFAGDTAPDGMQRLLNFYSWDAGAADTRPAPAGHIMPGEPEISGRCCSTRRLGPPGMAARGDT